MDTVCHIFTLSLNKLRGKEGDDEGKFQFKLAPCSMIISQTDYHMLLNEMKKNNEFSPSNLFLLITFCTKTTTMSPGTETSANLHTLKRYSLVVRNSLNCHPFNPVSPLIRMSCHMQTLLFDWITWNQSSLEEINNSACATGSTVYYWTIQALWYLQM